ncbi:NADH-quinone oxidoreductase subunit NuoE [Actinopolyspora erythraea]|uniref:NADH dehydrogenase n=1 Tax=Actinopolyspora erythraea TaxID=414996 RepID=A0A099D935_9ACTN|nr:NADH-quinone oxidoreductase subunit NuoE [Actinopolyspora erythraea]ASU80250.1 NADH-quinone oxidoreductase subunit NuoE [Actinopolyspora erythraea]KGI82668.1 NADH dehydrogenase [Actinopolyspora erythraea]
MTEQFDYTTTEHVLTPGGQSPAESEERAAAGDAVFGERVRAEARSIIERYPEARSALLPMLHLVQSVQGHVTAEGMSFCAEQLALSTAEVNAVATFYTMYKRQPCGRFLVSVCTNTLCAAMGGDGIYRALSEELGVGHEETAGAPGEEGSVTLEHAECLAACDFAPVLQVNYEYFDNQTAESALEMVRALRRGERPLPTRGAPLTDFRDTERQLAGFFDGPGTEEAAEASAAAPETVRGAELARERGWNAPPVPDEVEFPPIPEKK